MTFFQFKVCSIDSKAKTHLKDNRIKNAILMYNKFIKWYKFLKLLAFLSVMTKYVATLEPYEKEGYSGIRKVPNIIFISTGNEKNLLVGYVKC